MASLVSITLLLSILAYVVFFTDLGKAYFKADFFNVDFFQSEAVNLPKIQGAQINKRTLIPPLSNNLFGPLPSIEKPLTETQLNLQLKGTFPSSNEDQERAIIVSGNKEQLLYVGEDVLRGVTLLQVFNDYVVLDRSNVREILRFRGDGTVHFIPSSTVQANTKVTDKQMQERDKLTRELLEKYRAQLTENPSEALSSIGLTLADNRYHVAQDGPLAKAGLRPKDEIISINGQPIKALLNNPRTISSILSIGSVRIGFLRDRKRLSLNFKLN